MSHSTATTVQSGSITSNIPNGTVYHFNPYARQGNLPWTVVPANYNSNSGSNNNSIVTAPLAPPPKMSAPSPIASDEEDADGLTTHGADNNSLEGRSLDGSSGFNTPKSSALPQPLRHIVPTSMNQPVPLNGRVQYVQAAPLTMPHLHHITPRAREVPTSNGGLVQGNVHSVLSEYPVKYMSYADLRARSHANRQPQQLSHGVPVMKLFVGQVLHELRPNELSTLFSLLAQTNECKVVPHGPGCFFIELPAGQFRSARQLNGRVLFDVHGLWFAEGPEEAKTLQEYVASVKQELKTMRLPRSTLVVRR